MTDILVVDDERDIRELICDILEDEGFTTRRAGTSDECMAELNKAAPGLMILDIWLKDSNMDGIDILKHVKLDNPDVPVVIISGHGNIEIAVAAIKQGAYDFIEKPFNIDQLMVVIRRAMETSRLRRENAQLRRQEVRGTDMIGNSAGMKLLKSQLEKVTKSNGRVMLTGRARFRQGGRRALDPRQFQPLRRALRHRLLRRDPARPHGGGPVRPRNPRARGGAGASGTGPWRDHLFRRGRGHAARHPVQDPARAGGPVLHPRRRHGQGSRGSARDLLHDARSGRGNRRRPLPRGTLSPAERGADRGAAAGDRREDIPELAQHFIALFNAEQGLALRELGEDAVAMLQTMSWPGNVRQLRNMIERS
jgi:two-component system nitrogen regulation response regulator NtrX